MEERNKFFKDALWFFVFFGLVAAVFRLWFGLGPTTNLNDAMPWGLWKILNMVAGVALSTCGFTVGFLVYVLRIKRFKPLVRPAILIAFLGYGSSCLALLFDIGLPHRFWHPFIMWNEHSFLFEVFWCVMLYFTVTAIELAPNILEKFKADKAVKILHKIAFGVVVVGISLSSLHHSSLGSLFLTTPQRLHELWYTPALPLHFIVSAIGCGMMFLIFVKILYSSLYNRKPIFGDNHKSGSPAVCAKDATNNTKNNSLYGEDMPTLERLSVIAVSVLCVYFVLKIYDLFSQGSINALLAGTWESWLFGFELIITSIIPIVLVAIKKTRKSPYGLGIAAFFASAGLALNRVDVGILGYFRDAGTVYFPSLAEWALSVGVVAGAALVFFYVAETFSIFEPRYQTIKIRFGGSMFKTAFDTFSRVWKTALNNALHRVSLIGIFVLPVAFVLMYPPYDADEKENVEPASGLDVKRTMLLIDGNDNGIATKFPHLEHQQRLGDEKSCVECHHMSLPKDRSTPCARCHRSMYSKTMIFDHERHTTDVADDYNITAIHPENYSCVKCHDANKPKTSENAKTCIECHEKDMNITEDLTNFKYANSYVNSMHENCENCHKEQAEILKKPQLGECQTCHKNFDEKVADMKELLTEKNIGN